MGGQVFGREAGRISDRDEEGMERKCQSTTRSFDGLTCKLEWIAIRCHAALINTWHTHNPSICYTICAGSSQEMRPFHPNPSDTKCENNEFIIFLLVFFVVFELETMVEYVAASVLCWLHIFFSFHGLNSFLLSKLLDNLKSFFNQLVCKMPVNRMQQQQ